MNSKQLVQILKENKEFIGVFPCDKIPKKVTTPVALIANTHPHSKPGEHWVAFYIDHDKTGEYFDSYGRLPVLKEFKQFLNKNSSYWLHNTERVQGPLSTVCGQYCIFYLVHRLCCDIPMHKIIKTFDTTDLVLNDELVTEFVNETYDSTHETYDIDFIVNQISVASS